MSSTTLESLLLNATNGLFKSNWSEKFRLLFCDFLLMLSSKKLQVKEDFLLMLSSKTLPVKEVTSVHTICEDVNSEPVYVFLVHKLLGLSLYIVSNYFHFLSNF